MSGYSSRRPSRIQGKLSKVKIGCFFLEYVHVGNLGASDVLEAMYLSDLNDAEKARVKSNIGKQIEIRNAEKEKRLTDLLREERECLLFPRLYDSLSPEDKARFDHLCLTKRADKSNKNRNAKLRDLALSCGFPRGIAKADTLRRLREAFLSGDVAFPRDERHYRYISSTVY